MRSPAFLLAVAAVSGLTLTATLRFTLPTHNGAPYCATGEEPLSDLAAVRLYGAEIGEPLTLWQQHAATVPGAADSFVVTYGERPVSLWVAAVDSAGNEGCWAGIQLNGGLAVDPAPTGPGVRWYDVAGRRVREPHGPGVYFWRQGSRSGRLVRLR